MKHFGRLMLLTLGFVLFTVVLSSLPNHPAAAAPNQAVTVVNTSANPVPVTGSVNATLTGTVNAAQSGTWNVGFNGNTAATPLFVRDTDNPAKQPFVSFCSLSPILGLGSCNFATVPAGKELVIEMFTVSIRMVVGDKPLSSTLSGAANGTGYNLFYPLSFNGTETGQADDWTVSQPFTRAYADPSTTPVCIVTTNTGQGISLQCEISGYLVNVP